MQVLAHTGPSWHPAAVATHPYQPLLALAVRTTVLLYTPSGSLEAELRATGRGCVTSLTFCSAPALTHLLVVGTSNGFVRLFDWESRRVFRTVCESPHGKENAVFETRFVPRFPNVLVVVWQRGKVEWFRIEKGGGKIGELSLPFTSVLGVEVVIVKSDFMLVSGDTNLGGMVVKLDMINIGHTETILKGECIYGMSAVAVQSGDEARILLAAKGSWGGRPLLFESPDAHKWSLISSRSTQQNDNHGKFRCSVAWCGANRVVTSDPSGMLTTWRLEKSLNFVRIDSLQVRHVRQVFAIKIIHGMNTLAFASISMDRAMSIWQMCTLEGVEKWHLKFRNLRTTGPVRSLAITARDPHLSTEKALLGTAKLVSFSHGGTISVLQLNDERENCTLVGDITPFGNNGQTDSISVIDSVSTGNVSTEDGVPYASSLFIFGGINGQVGIILVKDNRTIEYILSRKRRRRQDDHRSMKWTNLASIAHDTMVSVADNGDAVEWNLCHGENYVSKGGQRKAITPRKSYNLRQFRGIGSAYRDAITITMEDTREYAFLIFCSDGSVSICSPAGYSLLPPVLTSLQNVGCAAFSGGSGLVAVADKNGSIATFQVHISLLFNKCKETECAVNVQRYDAFGEPITHLSWSPRPDGSLQPSPGNGPYLAGITSNGESVVFISDDQDRISLYTRLRGHSGNVCMMRWESPTFLLTAGEDGTVRRWDMSRQPRPRDKQTPK